MEVLLAECLGFCDGVRRALDLVERVLAERGAPVFVLHEIVHNEVVVEDLRRRGVVFIDDIRRVEPGRPLVFSAHGVPRWIYEAAANMGAEVVDATCPVVRGIHRRALAHGRHGDRVVVVGNPRHPEVVGTVGQFEESVDVVEILADVDNLAATPPGKNTAVLSQTTLNRETCAAIIARLRERFPGLIGVGNICGATEKRQKAVVKLATQCPLVLVVGSPKSSNSKRLVEVATAIGVRAELIRNADEIRPEWLEGIKKVGVTAAASTPEKALREVWERLTRSTRH